MCFVYYIVLYILYTLYILYISCYIYIYIYIYVFVCFVCFVRKRLRERERECRNHMLWRTPHGAQGPPLLNSSLDYSERRPSAIHRRAPAGAHLRMVFEQRNMFWLFEQKNMFRVFISLKLGHAVCRT